MSVLVEAISVIVPLETLRAKYPGGPEAYEDDCPNSTFCRDEHLTRVGFMSPHDVRWFVDQLADLGLEHVRDGRAVDLAVVDQFRGPTTPCDWLEAGKHPDGYAAAWKAGTIPGAFAYPPGWTPQQSRDLHFVSSEEVDERVLELAREDGVDVFLDFKTGKLMYISSPYGPQDGEPPRPAP
jgi:hypothetical protein